MVSFTKKLRFMLLVCIVIYGVKGLIFYILPIQIYSYRKLTKRVQELKAIKLNYHLDPK